MDFIDPKRFLIFIVILLAMTVSFLSGIIGLIVAYFKSRKAESSITEQKSFIFSMTAFIFTFFIFVFSEALYK